MLFQSSIQLPSKKCSFKDVALCPTSYVYLQGQLPTQQLLQATNNPDLQVDEETNNLALLDVQKHLQAMDKTLSMYGMPEPHAVETSTPAFATQMEAQEHDYDKTTLAVQVAEKLQLIQDNPGQLAVWTAVTAALQQPAEEGVSEPA